MKIVSYMLKRFFATFLASLFFFVLIFLLTDLLMNIWGYISNEVSPKTVGLILMYYVPKTIWYSIPIGVLFATSYMLSVFAAKNELLAVFASGISLYKFTMPLVFIAALMSVAMFFFDDKVVSKTYGIKQDMQNEALNASQDNRDIVVLSEGGKLIYKADRFDSKLNTLYKLYVIYRNNDRSFDGILYADSAKWTYDHWELSSSNFYKKKNGRYFVDEIDYDRKFRLTEDPSLFKKNTFSVEGASVEQAREYISRLEKSGLPSNDEKAEYYKKFAFPFVVLVVVLLAIGLSGKTRKNVLIVSLAFSISAVVLFYIMQMITMLMAKFGTVPPVFGEWFPVLFFIFLSILLLKYTKT